MYAFTVLTQNRNFTFLRYSNNLKKKSESIIQINVNIEQFQKLGIIGMNLCIITKLYKIDVLYNWADPNQAGAP